MFYIYLNRCVFVMGIHRNILRTQMIMKEDGLMRLRGWPRCPLLTRRHSFAWHSSSYFRLLYDDYMCSSYYWYFVRLSLLTLTNPSQLKYLSIKALRKIVADDVQLSFSFLFYLFFFFFSENIRLRISCESGVSCKFCLCWGFTAHATQWSIVERGLFT